MYLVCTLIFCKEQAYTRNCSGSVCLDINLLKPSRVELVDEPAPLLCISDTQACPPKWLEYIYRTAHPVLRWLPTKLAEWIGENLQDVLGFPDKADQRAEPQPTGSLYFDTYWYILVRTFYILVHTLSL
jgi:hypothetical protein